MLKWRHWDDILQGFNKTFDNSVVAMVTDLWRHWCRSMADSIVIENLVEHGSHAPPICVWLYKLKFFQQKFKFSQTNNFSNVI